MSVSLFVLVQITYPVPYDWKRVAGLSILAALCFGVWFQIESFQNFWMECVLIGCYLVGILLLRIVNLGNVTQLLRKS